MSRGFRWLLVAAILILLIVVPYHFWLTSLGGYLVQAEPPAKADAVVVLAGDYAGSRIMGAGDLVKQGFAPVALVSGPADFYESHETDLAIPFAVRHGYPETYFVAVPNESKSTAAEADAIIPELRKRNAHRVDVVTSDFHTRRAGRIYRSKAPDLEIHMVAVKDRYFSPDGWWKNREGRKTFLQEWLKTVAVWFGGM